MIQVETVGWRCRCRDWIGSHRPFCFSYGLDGCGGWTGSHQACVFLVGMWEAGDINKFRQETHGIERCMGTRRLSNITSMSIKRPPAHEKAARATFFPYGGGAPEQLFSPTVEINFPTKKTLFWIDLATGFGYFLDTFGAAVLGKVCRLWVWMCVCVSV